MFIQKDNLKYLKFCIIHNNNPINDEHYYSLIKLKKNSLNLVILLLIKRKFSNIIIIMFALYFMRK